MRVEREELPERQVLLQVEVDAEAWQDSVEKAYRRLAPRANIPGFRKGKAPRSIVERHLGRETLLEEAVDILLPQAYRQALAEKEVEAFASPRIEIVQREPLVFKATVPLSPTVELGDYRSIRMPAVAVEVSEEEVDAFLERLRGQFSTWQPVERPADFQDLLRMDAKGTCNGEPFLEQEEFSFIAVAGSVMPVPGFSEELVGLSAGEEKEFSLAFAPDHEDPSLAGSEFQFRVKVHQVEERQLPPLDDEFAQRLGEEYSTLEGLREAVRKQLFQNKEREARRQLENEVLGRVVAESTVEFPPILVEEEVDRLVREEERRFRDRGDRLDLFLSRAGQTEAELRAELEPLARERVRRALALARVGEAEDIEVAEAELDAEVERMAEANPAEAVEVRRLFRDEARRHGLEHVLYDRKVLERLVAIATQDEVEPEAPPTEAASGPAEGGND